MTRIDWSKPVRHRDYPGTWTILTMDRPGQHSTPVVLMSDVDGTIMLSDREGNIAFDKRGFYNAPRECNMTLYLVVLPNDELRLTTNEQWAKARVNAIIGTRAVTMQEGEGMK